MPARRDARLLVVDDDPAVVEYLAEELQDEGYEVVTATSGAEALDACAAIVFDLVITDVEMPGMRGLDLLAELQSRRPDQLVLLITAFGSIELAVQSIRAGASDFVAKPFRTEVLVHAIERCLRERRMRREIVRLRRAAVARDPGGIVARSPAMRRVMELAERVARTDSTVLLTGDCGVGKGTVARFIHDRSARARGPFVHVNCGAIPASLMESELFGVRRGAFTDARESRPGLFMQAHGGTLFLDEVAEIPLEAQSSLLQVLETRRVRALGETGDKPVDVRVLAATNLPLEEALKERSFRPDLYYRLNVIRIEVPPLRERREDIEALADLFLERENARRDRPLAGYTAPALRWMLQWSWPGGVRELSNLVERAAALTEHDTIVLDDLLPRHDGTATTPDLESAAARGLTLTEVEQAYIEEVLRRTGGNKSEAARILGIDRRTLYRRGG